MKKFVSFVFALISLFGFCIHYSPSTYATNVGAGIPPDVSALQEVYPEGMICTNTTPEFRLTVRCPGCIISAEGCWGYAILFVCDLYGLDTSKSLPVTWMDINKNIPSSRPKAPYTTAAESLQIGDILAAVNPSHAMVVISKDDSGVTLAEGNYGGRIHYGRHLSYASIDQNMAYVFRITPPSTQQGEHASCPCSTFTDMPAYGTCEHEAIDWAYTHRPYTLTAGTSSITFSPDAIVTRAQALTFIWRAAGKPEPTSTICPFADIASDAYYRKAVLWGVEKGITCGTSPTTFSPKKTCNRAEILTFLWRAVGSPAYSSDPAYSDVQSGKWYFSASAWAYEAHIEVGENGLFLAHTPCTRASTILYIYRAFEGKALATLTP